MTELYPLFFEPVLKSYIWGGRNLEKIGRKLPEDKNIAESWEISAHQDGVTVVKNGPLAGRTLTELLSIYGEDLIGRNNRWALDRGKFPLLVKLIDANKPLSVQVHPDDDYAKKHEGNELGKSEMWVVLDSETGAGIIYGLGKYLSSEAFMEAVKSGSLEEYLNFLPLEAGDHVCVPAGTLHAILAGLMIVEIQQNSNTTYRVYDWNRLGQDGKPRPLHVDKAIDVINYNQISPLLPQPITVHDDPYSIERLCQNQYFTTERITLPKGKEISGNCNGSTLEIWGVLSGSIDVAGYEMKPVTFVLFPAAMGGYKIRANEGATLLKTYVGPCA